MIKKFCDYCNREVKFSEVVNININRNDLPENASLKGMYAGGKEEICFPCYMELSKTIILLKHPPIAKEN